MIMAVLGMAHPYSEVKKNYKMIGSEFVIVLIMDMLLFTSDPSTAASNRSYIGFAMIAALGISLFLSQGSIIFNSLVLVKLRIKRLRLIRQKNRRMARRK